MKNSDKVRAVLEAVVWYAFTYYFIFVLRNPVEIWKAALVLVALAYLAIFICPWVRHTDSWRKMTGKA